MKRTHPMNSKADKIEVSSPEEVIEGSSNIINLKKRAIPLELGPIQLGFVKKILVQTDWYVVYTDQFDIIHTAVINILKPANAQDESSDDSLQGIQQDDSSNDSLQGIQQDVSSIDSLQHNEVMADVMRLNNLPSHNASSLRQHIIHQLGYAAAFSIEDDYKQAKILLKRCELELVGESVRTVKTWYFRLLVSCCFSLFVFGMLAYSRYSLPITECRNQPWFLFVICMIGGPIGIVLSSVSTKESNTGFAPFSTWRDIETDAAMRLVFGLMSSFVVQLAFGSGIVSTTLIKSDESVLPYILIAVAGGFLERWAIEIVRIFNTGNTPSKTVS